MYILGLSSYSHEASCALLKNGRIVALAEEERFNREKHTSKFPAGAINYCLKQAGISLAEINHVTFFWQPMREITGNAAHMLRYFPRSLKLLSAPSGGGELTFLERVNAMRDVGGDLRKHFSLPKAPKVHFVEHHIAHAASAFFVSPFEDAAILTIDGRGESTSTMISRGKGNKIEKVKEIKVPHSLGHLYAAITDYLGFKPFFDEWKVMGMSAYGKPTFVSQFEKLVVLEPDGAYHLNLDYFSFHVRGGSAWLSEKFHQEFGPPKAKGENFSQHAADIAYALQKVIEKAGLHLARYAQRLTGSKNLCMTGGVVLNCLMNKFVVENGPFEDYFFQPIANDAGTSLGSALYHYHHVMDGPREMVFDSVYWGPEFSNEEIEMVLKEKKVNYRKSANIAADTARQIADGKIVGWFQGRMESGPRALGNRSITSDPTNPKMKDILNARVKRREGFRPFAPSVLEEKASDYFEMPKGKDSPFMILIADVKKEMRERIPAITHADGTARVHTVSKKVNPRYWDLINEFEKIKGVPMLLNTSFNENEPIVCNPGEAVACFLRTEFDFLAIGDYLVSKNP